MIREAKEEINIEIKSNDLTLGHVMHRNTNRESIDFFFVCKKWTGTPVINEPDKCDLLEWYNIDPLPTNTIEYIRHAITLIKKSEKYSELGF